MDFSFNFLNFSSFTCTFFIQATQGVMSVEVRAYRLTEKLQKSEAEHEKAMSDMLRVAGENYKKLEDDLSRKVNMLKEANEKVRTEESKRAEAEAEIAKLQEKMKKLEAECISRLGNAHKEGMDEGLKKGKELGKEGAMGEVTAQFKLVYNSGFRHGWKSALSKTDQPETSDLFLRTNTSLPYPDAGLKNSDDEGDEGEEEEEEEGGAQEEEEGKGGEGRKEEEKEKEKEEVVQEKDQRQGDGQNEPPMGLLKEVGLTGQTSVTPEQSSQAEDVPEQPSSS